VTDGFAWRYFLLVASISAARHGTGPSLWRYRAAKPVKGDAMSDDNGAADETSDETSDVWSLAVLPEQVCYVIVKAREFDVKDAETDPDDGSNGADDGMIGVLEDRDDDPVRQELVSFIGALNQDAQVDLVAMAWMGRGDGDRTDWPELREQAESEHASHVARYLLGLPLLGDYLEEALAEFGQSCADFELGRL
jgi:hypothetical protein